MAVNCRAKRLVLNHIGSQFLPMKPNYSKKMDVRSDWELFDQVNIYNYLLNFCFHFSKFDTYHTTLNCFHDLFWISIIFFSQDTYRQSNIVVNGLVFFMLLLQPKKVNIDNSDDNRVYDNDDKITVMIIRQFYLSHQLNFFHLISFHYISFIL